MNASTTNPIAPTPTSAHWMVIHRSDHTESELAGVCFSPDGETLFVNIQRDALTLAIDGPWGRRRG